MIFGLPVRHGRVLVLVTLCGILAACEMMTSDAERVARAEKALADGNANAAIVDLKNVLQDDSGNAYARMLLARAELARGDVSAAAADLGRVAAGDVPPEQYEPLRWRILWAQRKSEDIVAGLAAPRPGLPEPERLTLLGRALAASGQSDAARSRLEEAIEADPDRGEAIAALAFLDASQGDVQGATELLTRAAVRLPRDPDVHAALGELHLRLGRTADAETAFRTAKDAVSARGDLLRYLTAAGGLADALLVQQKFDAAAALAKELATAAPNATLTLLVKGRVAAAQRDYATALSTFQRILGSDPNNAQVRTMVAAINLEQGSLEQAMLNLQQVLAASPRFDAARRLLAQVQLAQGRPKEALATLSEIDTSGPSGTEVELMKARAALASGDSTQAFAIMDRLEAQGLPTEAARLDLAAAFIQSGRSDRALELLSDAPAQPSDQREQLRLAALAAQDRTAAIKGLKAYGQNARGSAQPTSFAALALAALGEVDAARELLRPVLKERPNDRDLWIVLARVEARAGQLAAAEEALRRALEVRPGPELYVSLAQLAASRGDDAAARKWLEDGRASDPKSVVPRRLLVRAYVAEKRYDAARKIAEELIAIDPGKPEPRVLAASIALQRGDVPGALREADEAVRLGPDSLQAWMAKGEIHERGRQYDEARAAFRRAGSLVPASMLPVAALARLELAADNPGAALEAARRAQQRPETRTVGLRLEGEVLLRLGRANEAQSAFDRLQAAEPSGGGAILVYRARLAAKAAAPEESLRTWLESHPTDRAVRLALAEHWQRTGDRARAIAEYEAAVKAKADDAIALNNLAWLYHETGDARALATAQRAHQLAPRAAAIADTLGVILVATGRVDEGIAVLREAASSAPGFAEVQYHLADALSRKGSKAEAQQIIDGILRDAKAPGEVRKKAEALAKTLR